MFGEAARRAPRGEVLRNWDEIKQGRGPGREPGIFGEVPENLPGPLYARKVQRRAATQRLRLPRRRGPARVGAWTNSTNCAAAETPEDAFDELGDVLFAAVNVARKLKVDPELALRAASDRFRDRVTAASASLQRTAPKLERSRSRARSSPITPTLARAPPQEVQQI